MTNPPAVIPPHPSEVSPKPNGANGLVSVKPPDTLSAIPLHPSPMRAARKSSFLSTLLGWLVVAGIAGAGWYYREPLRPYLDQFLSSGKPPAAKPARIVPVSAAAVRQRDLPLYLNGLGTVTAFKTVTVRSRVEGELIKVLFEEGQMVKEGDLLAEIDPRPFEVQLAQAEGMLARDGATLKTARATLNRYEGLIAAKSLTAQMYDDQVALVNQTTAAMQTDEAMIANARLQLTYSRILAPISGRIGLRLVDQGNIIRANDLIGLAVITQLQPIALVFTIPQDDISRVQKRYLEEKTLVVDAFDRDFKMKIASGQLLAIDNQVDATTGTVRLKAKFENEDGMLFPNQFVNARMLVDTKPNAIVVPSAAVQRGPSSMFVYVIKTEKDEKTDETIEKVELRNVVTGPAEGAETSIESGLTPGEIVVTDGIDKLQPGSKVSTRKPDEKSGKGKKSKDDKAKDDKGKDATSPGEKPKGPEGSTGMRTVPETAGQKTEAILQEAAKLTDDHPRPGELLADPKPDSALPSASPPADAKTEKPSDAGGIDHDKPAKDTQ